MFGKKNKNKTVVFDENINKDFDEQIDENFIPDDDAEKWETNDPRADSERQDENEGFANETDDINSNMDEMEETPVKKGFFARRRENRERVKREKERLKLEKKQKKLEKGKASGEEQEQAETDKNRNASLKEGTGGPGLIGAIVNAVVLIMLTASFLLGFFAENSGYVMEDSEYVQAISLPEIAERKNAYVVSEQDFEAAGKRVFGLDVLAENARNVKRDQAPVKPNEPFPNIEVIGMAKAGNMTTVRLKDAGKNGMIRFRGEKIEGDGWNGFAASLIEGGLRLSRIENPLDFKDYMDKRFSNKQKQQDIQIKVDRR